MDAVDTISQANPITLEMIRSLGSELGIDWNRINEKQLLAGALDEYEEHPKVAAGNPRIAVQIALDHLNKDANYYDKEIGESTDFTDRIDMLLGEGFDSSLDRRLKFHKIV